VAQLLGRGDDEIVELLQGCLARFQRAGPHDHQLPDRFHDPARLFRHRSGGSAKCCASGELGVDRVALAEPLPRVPVRLVDLDDADSAGANARTSPAA